MSIKLEHISLDYQDGGRTIHALNDVNLEIKDQQFVGLIGHTGSGKSSLIQHLNGLIHATSGTIYYNGEDIYAENYSMRQLRNKVGLVFQYPEHQLFEIDVFTDVCFGPKNQGLSKEEIEARATDALKLVGLDESFYKKSPFELSGGQKRRVAIAGVLAMNPEVLVLDEPTAGLDPQGRDEILGQIKKLKEERHMTIVLVSHSMEDVARFVDRLIVMNHGVVAYDGTPREVFRNYKELEKIGLAAPQVTYLMYGLKEKGFDVNTDVITIEEAKAELKRVFGSSKKEKAEAETKQKSGFSEKADTKEEVKRAAGSLGKEALKRAAGSFGKVEGKEEIKCESAFSEKLREKESGENQEDTANV